MTTTFATATLATVKSFLVAHNAEAGLASAMKFDGWKIADVRTYAMQVLALREQGYVGALTPRNVSAVIQQLADERAAADAAAATAAELMAMVNEQVAAATVTSAATVTDKFIKLMNVTLENATNDNGTTVLTADMLLAAGWSKAYTTLRNGWSKTKSGGLAAASLGYTCATRADKAQPGGFVVVLARAA